MRETRKNIQTIFGGINRSMVTVLMLAFSLTACIESDWSPYKSKAEIYSTLLTSQASTVSGSTVGDPSLLWVLQVLQGKDFCSATIASGSVGQNFMLKFTANNTDSERVAKVRITFTDGYAAEFTIRQLAATDNMEYDRPWAEQPEYKEGVSLLHKTYYTTLSDN
ncbi:MAG: BACON domain-containing protein, partial [Alistipes sp.]|nr:BACON domain-containing protein [Alistipes sp.]